MATACRRIPNRRQRELLAQGQEGYGGQPTVMPTFDYPSNYGYDSDHPLAAGQVGKTGVVVDSLEDMERLFTGFPLDRMHTVFIIDAPAPIVLAMYLAHTEDQGIERGCLRGSITNNTLGSFIGNNMYVFPPRAALLEPPHALRVENLEGGLVALRVVGGAPAPLTSGRSWASCAGEFRRPSGRGSRL